MEIDRDLKKLTDEEFIIHSRDKWGFYGRWLTDGSSQAEIYSTD